MSESKFNHMSAIGKNLTLKIILDWIGANDDAHKELQKCDTYDFNIFKLREYTEGREMEATLSFILAKRDCLANTTVDTKKMMNFVRAIQAGYKNVPYHNKTHGADLCQTINYFLTTGQLGQILNFDSYEYLAVLTAATVHDFEHPGVNNIFLQKIQDPIATRHNDRSVLESHHIAASFEVMLGNPQNNWAFKMNSDDFQRVRQLMIDCVLATDMSLHFTKFNALKGKVTTQGWQPNNYD